MRGFNAFFLLVETCERVKKMPHRPLRKIVKHYLSNELKLDMLKETGNFNALRFWAFNDFPKNGPQYFSPACSADGGMWLTVNRPDKAAFETLDCLIQELSEMEFHLVPVLSNFWPSYGGILRYLAWAGHLKEKDYFKALCSQDEEQKMYERRCLQFYISPEVESIFRLHTGKVLSILCESKRVPVIEVMNEPRTKNPYSLKGKTLPDGSTSSDLVATWLNRQGNWIKRFYRRKGKIPPYISSGEEGWTAKPAPLHTMCLEGKGQYYEGIDLVKNINNDESGITVGSVHMYPHPTVTAKRKNICGSTFTEKQGWGYLLRADVSPSQKNYEKLAEEWLMTRGRLYKGHPWYVGEMGWDWPYKNKAQRNTLFQKRTYLYRKWHEITLENGGAGTFVWMLNGIRHKDPFYGLTTFQLATVMPRKKRVA